MNLNRTKDKSFSGALLGYRRWKFNETAQTLGAIAAKNIWEPGLVHEASCQTSIRSGHGKCPDVRCDCGIYAYYSRDKFYECTGSSSLKGYAATSFSHRVSDVEGAIIASGSIMLHSDGFRCEQAQIVGLVSSGSYSFDIISRKYKVPVFAHRSELDRYIAELKSEYNLISEEETYITAVRAAQRDYGQEIVLTKDDRGRLHSINGQPSVIDEFSIQWHNHGLLHRDPEVGPAVYYKGLGIKEYWMDGRPLCHKDIPTIETADGEKRWLARRDIGNNVSYGLHREDDLPAKILPNGDLTWCKNGEIHRDDDLPAFIGSKGTKAWLQHGSYHRTSGPARIAANGQETFWLKGEEYRDIDEWEEVKANTEKILAIMDKGRTDDNLREALKYLPEKERQVLTFRYGLDGSSQRTLQHIADKTGMTRERVRMIARKAEDTLNIRLWKYKS